MTVESQQLADGRVVHYVRITHNKKRISKRIGSDKREAERQDVKLKEDLISGRYQDLALSQFMRVGQLFSDFLPTRTNRAAAGERQQVTAHVLNVMEWFTTMRVIDVRPPHIAKVIETIRKSGKLAESSITNIHTVMSGIFQKAVFRSLVATNPCKGLEKGTIIRGKKKKREPYSRGEARSAMWCDSIRPEVRMFLYLAFYCGMREGEICGRRFRDWMASGQPLGGLKIHDQYDGQPLKTDDEEMVRPRLVPVHPELQKMLTEWWDIGFELVYCRKPTEDDFIVPTASLRNHSRSSAYKMFRTALRRAGVTNKTLHSTRHTFISVARASTNRHDLVERMTHNSKGTQLDQYTHDEWESLCEIMTGVDYSIDRSTSAGFLGGGPPARRESLPGVTVRPAGPVNDLSERRVGHSTVIEFKGESCTVTQWEAVTGIPRKTIADRLNMGWTVESALTLPLDSRKMRRENRDRPVKLPVAS